MVLFTPFILFFRLCAWLVSKISRGRWSPPWGLPKLEKLRIKVLSFLRHLESRRKALQEDLWAADRLGLEARDKISCYRSNPRPAATAYIESEEAEAAGIDDCIGEIKTALEWVAARTRACRGILTLLMKIDVADDRMPAGLVRQLRAALPSSPGQAALVELEEVEQHVNEASDQLQVNLEGAQQMLTVGSNPDAETPIPEAAVAIERTTAGRLFRRTPVAAAVDGSGNGHRSRVAAGNGGGKGNGNGHRPTVVLEEEEA